MRRMRRRLIWLVGGEELVRRLDDLRGEGATLLDEGNDEGLKTSSLMDANETRALRPSCLQGLRCAGAGEGIRRAVDVDDPWLRSARGGSHRASYARGDLVQPTHRLQNGLGINARDDNGLSRTRLSPWAHVCWDRWEHESDTRKASCRNELCRYAEESHPINTAYPSRAHISNMLSLHVLLLSALVSIVVVALLRSSGKLPAPPSLDCMLDLRKVIGSREPQYKPTLPSCLLD